MFHDEDLPSDEGTMPRGKQLAEKNKSRKYSKITTVLGFQTCQFLFFFFKMLRNDLLYVLAGNAGVCYSTTDSCYSQVRVDGESATVPDKRGRN